MADTTGTGDQLETELARLRSRIADLERRIADERQVAERLREAEERFRLLYERAPLGYQSLDDDGCILHVNQAWLDLLGYEREEVLGKWFGNFLTPEYVEHFRHRFPCFKAEGEIHRLEFVLVRKDGTPILVEYDGRIGRTTRGDFDCTHCILHDVTAQKRSELALIESEQRYRALFESASDAMFIVSVDKDYPEILDCNCQALELFQRQREEMIGHTPIDLSPPEQPDGQRSDKKAVGLVRDALTGKTQRFEWTHTRGDGTLFDAGVTLNRVEIEGHPFLQVHVRDITLKKQARAEREELERQLRQSQKMEVVGQLAGGVAHDFNNLLTVILGNVEVARLAVASTGGECIPQQLTTALDQIQKAASTGATLTRQMLTFGRREVATPIVLDLNGVISGMSDMLRRLIGEHIEITTTFAADLSPIKADKGQIEQVIMNLCLNARDAMPDGGVIIIETANVNLDEAYVSQNIEAHAGPHVRVSVRDTGIGIDEDAIEHLFEPFYTTKPVGKGTGLGLSTVFGVVRGSGGHITVESRVDQGTTFRLYFPATLQQQAPAEEPVAGDIAGLGETILLCEDESMVRRLTRMCLTDQGYHVIEASDGRQALEVAAHHDGPIDLLVTDLIMPRMNGRELSKELAKSRPETRVLFMSGHTTDVLQDGGLGMNPRTFIQKPFHLNDFLQRVRTILDRR